MAVDYLLPQAAEVIKPGLPCLDPYNVPSYRVGVLVIVHTDRQRHQAILLAGALWTGIRGQHQRLQRHFFPARGHPLAEHPLQQRGEEALYLQLLNRNPGINAVGIVIQQLRLQLT